jgi:hypothetical protein
MAAAALRRRPKTRGRRAPDILAKLRRASIHRRVYPTGLEILPTSSPRRTPD